VSGPGQISQACRVLTPGMFLLPRQPPARGLLRAFVALNLSALRRV